MLVPVLVVVVLVVAALAVALASRGRRREPAWWPEFEYQFRRYADAWRRQHDRSDA